MSPKKQVNIRASRLTIKQIEFLTERLGMTRTEILTLAIDRLYREYTECKSNDKEHENMQ